MDRGDWERALACWEECLRQSSEPQQADWLLGKVSALASLGRMEDADACCRAGAVQWPGDVRFLRHRAALATQMQERPRAIALLQALIRRQPDDLSARLSRACLLAAWGAPQQCRDLLDEIFTRGCPMSDQLLARMLGAIQYCCRAEERTGSLGKLAALARAHAERERTAAAEILHAEVRLALEDYEAAGRIVAAARGRGERHPALEGIAEVCARRLAPGFPDHGAPKIFCIGLSKTATTSLDSALKTLGYRSLHWINPYTRTLISEQDLLLFDAFSDIGIAWRFEQLHARFPDARFIYTTRPVAEWARSVAAHYARMHGVREPREYCRPAFCDRYDGAAGQAELKLYAGHDSWEAAYRAFDDRVRAFFATKPRDRFLELAICAGDGWEKLCGFLGLPVPAVPFPIKNAARATAP